YAFDGSRRARARRRPRAAARAMRRARAAGRRRRTRPWGRPHASLPSAESRFGYRRPGSPAVGTPARAAKRDALSSSSCRTVQRRGGPDEKTLGTPPAGVKPAAKLQAERLDACFRYAWHERRPSLAKGCLMRLFALRERLVEVEPDERRLVHERVVGRERR